MNLRDICILWLSCESCENFQRLQRVYRRQPTKTENRWLSDSQFTKKQPRECLRCEVSGLHVCIQAAKPACKSSVVTSANVRSQDSSIKYRIPQRCNALASASSPCDLTSRLLGAGPVWCCNCHWRPEQPASMAKEVA